ncbi:MAG TPA: LacI family DNA-binding transcriptional regulator [Sphingomicrobium sp.]|nr:LacI family DNA-binding transcriptional regulator [Sphingomicrobium sp.]
MNKPSRRSSGSVTIEDVAREAGVSAMTVSRVINNEQNVRDKTRRQVLEVIKKLHYSPNAAARSLAAGEATHIGLLYSNPSAAYLSQFLVGALDAARAAGAHLVIEACQSDDEADQAQTARHIAEANVEGVILPPPLSEAVPILTELAVAEVPVVTVAMGKLYSNALNVRIDDFAAAREVTEYLLSLRHRRIGFIKGHPQQIASAERERGFLTAVQAAGLASDDIMVEQGYFTFRSGLEAAERLLDRDNRPTAIFASNDDMAAAVVGVAHRRGLDVPGDLSVVGFDDTAPATTVWPELTTVRQPVSTMAGAALDMLMADLRARRRGGSPTPAERVLAHELVIRQSTALPRDTLLRPRAGENE